MRDVADRVREAGLELAAATRRPPDVDELIAWPARRRRSLVSTGALVLGVMAIVVLLLAGLVRAFGGATVPAPRPAAPTVSNGRIAFSALADGTWQIFSVEPDGSALTQLTRVSDAVAESPAWSPDGTKIAYVVDENGGNGPSRIWLMNANGSDPHEVTSGPGSSWSPAWSPDGSHIAFANGNPSEIYTITTQGTDLRQVTSGEGCWADPSWSPDGSMIAFDQSAGDCQKALWVVSADGTGQRQLLALPGLQTEPVWSPDGQTIAFANYPPNFRFQIDAIDPSGRNLRVLTDQAEAQQPAWSPGGTEIVFTAVRPGSPDNADNTLFLMNADGTDVHELSGLPRGASFPSWQPVPQSASPSPTPSPTTSVEVAPQSLVVMNQNSDAVEVRVAEGSSHIVQTYPLGADSDVALSPDGRRLYAAGWLTNNGRSRFFVYDTTSGRLLSQISLPDWAQYTGYLTHEIAASPDGNRVYVLVHPFDGRPFSLASYDIATGSMLPRVAPLPGCAPVSILPESGQNVIVVCHYQNEVRFLQIASSGALSSQAQLSVPTSGSTVTDTNGNTYSIGHVAQAMLSPDASILYVVTQDGSVFVIDARRQAILRTVHLPLPSGDVIAFAKAELSSDGQELVLGLSSSYPGGDIARADTLMVIDTRTWHAT